jgi:isopentenyl-diphosphate delta-isomerase type 1
MFSKPVQQTVYVGMIFIVLAIGAFFMANVELPPWSHYLSALNVALFALPAFWAVRRWLGWRDGAILIAILGIYALAIEASAILTGFPYGHFGYSDLLGYRIFGLVPWTVAFAWTPLILGAYAVAANLFASFFGRVIATTIILTAFDVVLDPGAVMLGFWRYEGGGWFYGVPLSNFAGWLVSGLIGSVVLEALVRNFRPLLPVPMHLASSVIFMLFFWSMIAAFGGLVSAALIGIALLGALFAAYSRFHYTFDDKIVFVDEQNRAIATGDKLPSHTSDTKLHRAFSVFLFNERGEFLMQQRAMSKKTWPGVWSNSCCGHPMLHEKPLAAAKRRIEFELGITPKELRTVLPDFRYRAELDGIVENEICPVMVGIVDSEPLPQPSEVMAIRWVDWGEFLEEADRPDTSISPWAVLESAELRKSDEFRAFLATLGRGAR